MAQTAVIGLGAMGLPIAQRLAESLPVAVLDPDSAIATLLAAGRNRLSGQ